MSTDLLSVHGFVLAGGKSSRMGQDKALLPFCGVPLIEIALAKLHNICSHISIVGNRPDLASFAPVVEELRVDSGPAAGIEAGLAAAHLPWALFIPVDTPFMPMTVLRRFAEVALEIGAGGGLREFHLFGAREQPTFCVVQAELLQEITSLLNQGERKLVTLFHRACSGRNRPVDFHETLGEDHPSPEDLDRWFSNINTPQELAEAEAWAQAEGWQPPRLTSVPY